LEELEQREQSVQVIDVFVEIWLSLASAESIPRHWPAFVYPSVLLKLYSYGYPNGV
jgi:hypothetical protein